MTTEEQSKYENAFKRVKKIKGFYSHLLVYIVINIMILIVNVQSLDKGESYVSLKNFSTALFWGIGLAAHGLSVFGPNIVLGQNWEEEKIKELMEKEKLNKYE
jgi:uncharacterized integral membrane protein